MRTFEIAKSILRLPSTHSELLIICDMPPKERLFSEFKSSGGDDPEDVVIKGKDHQKDDEDQADLLGDLHLLETDRFPKMASSARKRKWPPSRIGNGKEIDDPEIDAEDGHEEGEAQDALFSPAPRRVGRSGSGRRSSLPGSPSRSISQWRRWSI